MKNTRKILLVSALVLLLGVLFCFSAGALDATGNCGDEYYDEDIWEWVNYDVTYSYNSTTKEVIISGEGEMDDFSWNDSPFYESPIKSVVIEDGVTSVAQTPFNTVKALQVLQLQVA